MQTADDLTRQKRPCKDCWHNEKNHIPREIILGSGERRTYIKCNGDNDKCDCHDFNEATEQEYREEQERQAKESKD